MLVFQGDIQIAHIKHDTLTRNYKDQYTVYLPDKFSAFVVPMLLFVLYYDYCEHGNGGELISGVSVEKTWSYFYGDANLLYDPKWLKVNFPREYIVPVEVDKKKSKTLGKILSITQLIIAFVYVASVLWLFYMIATR